MAGLIFLGFLVAWLLVAGRITALLLRALPVTQRRGLVRVAVFVLVAALPAADEIVGRWQFARLCDEQAKAVVAPGAASVVAARARKVETTRREGYAIPISSQTFSYVDAATGAPFVSTTSFQTEGGWIMRLGLNMGSIASCSPSGENAAQITPAIRKVMVGQRPVAGPADRWAGKWLGPEGTFLEIAGGHDRLRITIRNLDGPRTFEGTRRGDRITFVRDDRTESISAGSGAQTGMKWLADKSDCLVVQPGEGYCRD